MLNNKTKLTTNLIVIKKADEASSDAEPAATKAPFKSLDAIAGSIRPRPASPRGAPWASSSPNRYVGTIPKYKKEASTDAQVERSRLREQCGYRG